MKKTLATVLASAAMMMVPATAHAMPAPDQNHLPTCIYEDSTNCLWNASTEGNGAGFSFYDLGGEVHYFNPTLDRWERDGVSYDFVSDHDGLADNLAEGEGKVNGDSNWEDCLIATKSIDLMHGEVICDDGTHEVW